MESNGVSVAENGVQTMDPNVGKAAENGTNLNAAFDPSPEKPLDFVTPGLVTNSVVEAEKGHLKKNDGAPERQMWENQLEFLMSCIALSVGLGNIWRFPFVAYRNGGGAFLIPYIIMLLLIGVAMYYMETAMGQFSSRNGVKIWSLCPAMKGTGYVQALGVTYVLTYYLSFVALTLYYMGVSFQAVLPWSQCQPDWDYCVPSGQVADSSIPEGEAISSAELYFTNTVLRKSDGIHDGIGTPLWDLTLCLLASWVIVFAIVARGVKSTGKAAYFLALFPYVVLIILLIRAVTLPGAVNGILYFLVPEWSKLLEPSVWYAAVTQMFFSLSVTSGAIIMFSSYNSFTQNVFRDSLIVASLDTCTSLISGLTIFGILGNLAYQLGTDDVSNVVGSGGASLAFISYPDAIAQSPFVPQLFSVLFFLMMAVLGVGSGVALLSVLNTIIKDAFPRVPIHYIAMITCCCGFLLGLVYVTPGGQYVFELVDHSAGNFMRLFAAISEIIGFVWIYGLENICLDIEFMLGRKTCFYWRICLGIFAPIIMSVIFLYAVFTTDVFLYANEYEYPRSAYIAGDVLQYAGLALVPIFMIGALVKYRSEPTFGQTIRRAFRKKPTYGPKDPQKFEEWRQFRREAKYARQFKRKNWFNHIMLSLVGGYRWN